MGAALLRLDVSAAWAANPFVFLLLVALAVGAAAWVVCRPSPPHQLPSDVYSTLRTK